jgi:cell division protein FtsB
MLEQNQKNLNKLIGDCKIELAQLKSNAQTIEKYAREKYYMKKENEDLFIVNTEEKK